MTGYRDHATAVRSWQRLESGTGAGTRPSLEPIVLASPDPDRALNNLERWLGAVGNPRALADQMAAGPHLASVLVSLLAASDALADALVQNPETGAMLLDPSTMQVRPTVHELEREIALLLSSTNSMTHAHDRLRYVKQTWLARIAAAEVVGAWGQPEVWQALSDLADALIVACRDLLAEGKPAPEIVAFGKLGGGELNLSSDVDLVLVQPEGSIADDSQRLGERLGRALADRMGRGALYRVDFRLRPFGRSGPLVPSRAALQAYYERYAEPWEILALVRSRGIGSPEFCLWWDELRDRFAFRDKVSRIFVDELLTMRRRVEDHATEGDLKRGAGGIRDVEFLVQTVQLVHGASRKEFRVRSTLDALGASMGAGVLPSGEARALAEGYTFLRQLENRCQLVADTQTHRLPAEPATANWVARTLGYRSAPSLMARLDATRATVRSIYDSAFPDAAAETPDRLKSELGPVWPIVVRWLGPPDADLGFWRALAENSTSLARVRRVASEAPAFVEELAADLALTEQVIDGEILELAPIGEVSVRSAWRRLLVRQAISEEPTYGSDVWALAQATFGRLISAVAPNLSVVALGSFATEDLGPRSDLDVLLVADSPGAEAEAEALLATVQSARIEGFPFELDVRLRPEGRKGLLVVGSAAAARYSESAMEDWERLAWGRARLVAGVGAAEASIVHLARALPLDRPRLDGVLKMKFRIESERIPFAHKERNIKLSSGGLGDIDWLAELLAWAYHSEVERPAAPTSRLRIGALQRAGVLNAVEADALLAARDFFYRLRLRIAMQGFEDDVLPENPDRLAVLASLTGLSDGNALILEFASHRTSVRAIFEDALSRV